MRAVRLAVVLVLLGTQSLPAAADSDQPWVFEGGGWGHGVGLSQFGALGMAQQGYGVDEIVGHFYSGANLNTLQEIGAPAWLAEQGALWIGITQNRDQLDVEAIGDGFEVCIAGDGSDDCTLTDMTLSDGDLMTVGVVSTDPLTCTYSMGSGAPLEGDCWADVTWAENPEINRIEVESIEYSRGSLHIRPNGDGDGFHLAVSLGLEEYLYGIAEVPLQWDSAALQTQAVIARSYGAARALARSDAGGDLTAARRNLCWCHLFATVLDQNYDGWSGGMATEGHPQYGDDWRAAVDATESQIVTHPEVDSGSKIVSTFYSSSNGGWSENNEDVWGGPARPYLRSVEDQWSADPEINPLSTWTILVDDADMATALGWDRVLDALLLEGPPGVKVRFKGKRGGTDVEATLNGTQIRSLLMQFGYRADGASVRVSPFISAVTDPPGFDDTVGHLFEQDIEWALSEGVTKGCNPPANTRFCPNDLVTRDVMAAFLSRFLDLPPASRDYFVDDDGSLFEGDINRLAEAGITRGCGSRRFCPEDVVDRGQMAAFLSRAFNLVDSGGSNAFDDDDDSLFENDIDRIAAAGITKGCNPPRNTRYCPDLPLDRGAMMAFLHRAAG